MIPLTLNGESLFTQVNKRIYAAAEGAGLTHHSSMLGVYLAEWACGENSEELRYLKKTTTPRWCPPEPFKAIGVNVRLADESIAAKGDLSPFS